MLPAESVTDWLFKRSLSATHVDCIIAVMLKILDGKCKMHSAEKLVMQCLYDQTQHLKGSIFEQEIHDLIALSRSGSSDELRQLIYEKRVLAETMISRPVMKTFKKMIRSTGLLDESTFEIETFETHH